MTTTSKSKLRLPTLYRADSLPKPVTDANKAHRGRTWANYYVTEGLLAKFNDGGHEQWMRRSMGFLLAAHVGYLSSDDPKRPTLEQEISYHSPFLSVALSVERALVYLDRSGRAKFESCSLPDATHFMWKLAGIEAVESAPGRFDFTYPACIANVRSFLEEEASKISQNSQDGMSHILGLLPKLIVANNICQDKSLHYASLFDVAKYLRNTRDEMDDALRTRAISNAERDQEWLLFPRDPMPDGIGASARFTLNQYLSLESWLRDSRRAKRT